MKREDVIRLFPEQIREILRQADWNPEELQEIRLRAGKPLILRQQGKEYFLSRKGMLTRHKELAYLVSQEQIRTTMEYFGAVFFICIRRRTPTGISYDTGRSSGGSKWENDHRKSSGERGAADFLH